MYILRVLGTVFGLIITLLVWYIGNGDGYGNPYTTGLVLAVFLLPITFVRVHSPPRLLALWVLCVLFSFSHVVLFRLITNDAYSTGITVALIWGYSWIDGHLEVVGNLGHGWSVAWRREFVPPI